MEWILSWKLCLRKDISGLSEKKSDISVLETLEKHVSENGAQNFVDIKSNQSGELMEEL